ncbi:hypothetical protein [Streptomyces tubercidicus]
MGTRRAAAWGPPPGAALWRFELEGADEARAWRSSRPASNSTFPRHRLRHPPHGNPRGIVTAHPRPDFKRRILHAFHAGLAHRPRVALGNAKADVLDRLEDHYTRPNFARIIEDPAWPE